MTIPLGPPLPAGSSCQPGPLGLKRPCRDIPVGISRREAPIRHCSRWGLPCRSGCPSRGGLLPHRFTLDLRERRRSVLCGAFPRVAPAGRYPAPLLHGVRTFLDPEGPRPSGHPRKARLRCVAPARSTGERRARPAAIARSASSSGPASPRAGTAGGPPQAAGPPPPPDSRTPAHAAAKSPGAARLRPDRQPRPRQPPPVEPRTRIALALGRHVGMRDHAVRARSPSAP